MGRKTITVRIAVAVWREDDGIHYNATGWGIPGVNESPKYVMEMAIDVAPSTCKTCWIEAEVPVPGEEVIAGRVVEVPNG